MLPNAGEEVREFSLCAGIGSGLGLGKGCIPAASQDANVATYSPPPMLLYAHLITHLQIDMDRPGSGNRTRALTGFRQLAERPITPCLWSVSTFAYSLTRGNSPGVINLHPGGQSIGTIFTELTVSARGIR